jgi:hypothetical protein
VALLKAIQRDLARPPGQTPRLRFAEEGLCSRDAAIWAKQKIPRLAVLIHGPIGKVPLALDLDVGFIHAPGGIHRSGEAVPSLLKLRHKANHPTMNRRVRHANAALGHHRHEISIAQPVGDVPADAQLDDLGIEAATSVNRISDYGLVISASLGRQNCTTMPFNATEPLSVRRLASYGFYVIFNQ